MDWGSLAVGLLAGMLVGPLAWALVRVFFSSEHDEEAAIHVGHLGDGSGPLGLD